MNREEFLSKTEQYAERIDTYLEAYLQQFNHVKNLHDGVNYSMGLDVPDRATRGKRIRPVLCLLSAEALGGNPEKALSFAAAIELLHNFALVHDDIEDGDHQRRDRDATWVKYGTPHGINIGDYMLAKVFHCLYADESISRDVRWELTGLLNETMEHLFIGQSLEITARENRDFNFSVYKEIVSQKTGSYLAAPVLGGIIAVEGDRAILPAIQKYGHALGPLFQIKDDIIDLTSGKGRGEIGNDIREGKRSYLVAAALEKASSKDSEKLYDILDASREETSDDMVKWCIALFEETGAIERGDVECERLAKEASEAIESVPDDLRFILEAAANMMSKRVK